MPKRGYDLQRLENAMAAVKVNPKSASNLMAVRRELNTFFPEAKCNSVMYTDNKDKMFFGMMVMPYLSDEQVTSIALSDGNDKDALRVKEYSIDIDSKLFDNLMLNNRELTAVVLHEVGHLVIDDSPAKIIQKNMDEFLHKERTNIDAEQLAYCTDIVKFGIEDAMVKAVSLWYRDEEVVADSFVVSCGYGEDLKNALKKISRNSFALNKGADIPKFIMLHWSLRLYKDIHLKRVPAIKTLDKAASISGSGLLKGKIDFLKKRLTNYVAPLASVKGSVMNPIVDISVKESAEEVLWELNIFKNMKLNGLRSIESDSYEYEMRIRNVEDEEEALAILHEINVRLSMLENYITNNKLSSNDAKKYEALYKKYCELRDELSKKKIYKKKNYGLWYDYNSLSPDQTAMYV